MTCTECRTEIESKYISFKIFRENVPPEYMTFHWHDHECFREYLKKNPTIRAENYQSRRLN